MTEDELKKKIMEYKILKAASEMDFDYDGFDYDGAFIDLMLKLKKSYSDVSIATQDLYSGAEVLNTLNALKANGQFNANDEGDLGITHAGIDKCQALGKELDLTHDYFDKDDWWERAVEKHVQKHPAQNTETPSPIVLDPIIISNGENKTPQLEKPKPKAKATPVQHQQQIEKLKEIRDALKEFERPDDDSLGRTPNTKGSKGWNL